MGSSISAPGDATAGMEVRQGSSTSGADGATSGPGEATAGMEVRLGGSSGADGAVIFVGVPIENSISGPGEATEGVDMRLETSFGACTWEVAASVVVVLGAMPDVHGLVSADLSPKQLSTPELWCSTCSGGLARRETLVGELSGDNCPGCGGDRDLP